MKQVQSIGLVLNDLRKEKRVSVAMLSERLNLTRQGVYDTFNKRSTLNTDEMGRWAKALEMDVNDLYERAFGEPLNKKSADNGEFGDEVLQTIRKLLEEELKEKNEQIKALTDALQKSQELSIALLGKSREYPNFIVMPNQQHGRPVKAWSNR